jgi:hypothetical protein
MMMPAVLFAFIAKLLPLHQPRAAHLLLFKAVKIWAQRLNLLQKRFCKRQQPRQRLLQKRQRLQKQPPERRA